MTQLITAHADAPLEFIFWPLLTAVASFIGTNGINSEWVEPSIMWFVIAAKKGEQRIRKPVEDIERDLIREWGRCSPSAQELHSIMSRNNGWML